MIKIQEHLDRFDADSYIENLAKKHWIELNPRYADNRGYKSVSLIEKCKKYYSEASTSTYIKKYANDDKTTSKRHKDFYLLLKKDRFKFLKSLITSKPDRFELFKTEILKILKPTDLYTINGKEIKQTSFGKLLTNSLFNYTSFRDSRYCTNLFDKLGFSNASCPYCNDRKVEIIKRNNFRNTAYFDLDHFYPKSQNPFFALSFYNLIPSCKFCNSTEKGNIAFNINTHIHPYYQSFDDFYEFKIPLIVNIGDPIKAIQIEPRTINRFDNLKDFNLINRYHNRLNDVEQVVRHYLNNYKKLNSPYEEKLFIDFFIDGKNVPLTKNSILKHNKGKLYRDILLKLDEKNKILGIL